MASRKNTKKRRAGKSVGTLSRRREKPSLLRRWLGRLFWLTLLLGLLGFAAVVGIFWHYGKDLPDVASLREYNPPQTTRILDRNGELLGEIFNERRTVVPMERIPRALVLSVLAAEDADFYQHEGFDYPGIVRALIQDVREGRAAQGASTITQQVVKLLLLSHDRTIERKVRELILARRLEQELTKDEILHLYLNTINFGHGRYGAQEAAQFYFGKNVEDLTLAEASLIAGVPQAPARLSPRSHLENAQRRQAFVLRQLSAKRSEYWPDLSEEEIEEARNAEVTIIPRATVGDEAGEILPLARRMLREVVGEDAYRRGGFTVHTTLDLNSQRRAREALRRGLGNIDDRQHYRAPVRAARGRRRRRQQPLPEIAELAEGRSYPGRITGTDDEEARIYVDVGGHNVFVPLDTAGRYNPDDRSASAFAEVGARVQVKIIDTDGQGTEGRFDLGPQGAVVLIDPRSRDVLALVGSYEGGSGFNRATQAVRQPGSTFKPFVYALGIRSRAFTPATVMVNAPAVYDEWRPQNYETWSYDGDVRLRSALARSINLVAVRAIETVGPAEVAAFAQQLGINSELQPTLALALGASGVRPLELTNAYATFAAGGRWQPPRFVSRIVDANGEELPLPQREASRDVLTPAEAFITTSMLQSVVQEGTARSAGRTLRQAAAGKTGTSNEARDAWFVGYTPNAVAGVWVGFDDRRPLGRREGGGRSALPIWTEVIAGEEESRPVIDFPRPSGIETALIDPATGHLAHEGMEGAIEEVFLDGTVPTEVAIPQDAVDDSAFLMEQFEPTP